MNTFFEGYMYKEAGKPTPSYIKKNPKYKTYDNPGVGLKDNYTHTVDLPEYFREQVGFVNYDQVMDRARQAVEYSKKNNIPPIDLKALQKGQIPIVDAPFPKTLPKTPDMQNTQTRIEFPVSNLNKKNFHKIWSYLKENKPISYTQSRGLTKKDLEEPNPEEYLGHEVNHALHAHTGKIIGRSMKQPALHEWVRKKRQIISDHQGINKLDQNSEAYKLLKKQYEKYQQKDKNMKYPSMEEWLYSNPAYKWSLTNPLRAEQTERDKTYVDTNPMEYGPPAGALQRHLQKTEGRQITEPEEYYEWINKYDDWDNEDINKSELPLELKRLLRYRIRAEKWSPQKKNMMDEIWSKLIPALITMNSKNKQQRTG